MAAKELQLQTKSKRIWNDCPPPQGGDGHCDGSEISKDKSDAEGEIESFDDVKSFFSEINTINLLIEKRKRDLENQINDAQMQLRFIEDLRGCPKWIHSFLEKKKELREKIK